MKNERKKEKKNDRKNKQEKNETKVAWTGKDRAEWDQYLSDWP